MVCSRLTVSACLVEPQLNPSLFYLSCGVPFPVWTPDNISGLISVPQEGEEVVAMEEEEEEQVMQAWFLEGTGSLCLECVLVPCECILVEAQEKIKMLKMNQEGCKAEVVAEKDDRKDGTDGQGCEAKVLAIKAGINDKDDAGELDHGQILEASEREGERDDQGVVEQGTIALPRPYTPQVGKKKVKFGTDNKEDSKEHRTLGEEILGEGDLCGLLERRGLTSNEEGSPPPQEPTRKLVPLEVEKQEVKKKKELQRQEWRKMMVESREKQDSWLKAEEAKNTAKKARN